MRTISDVVTSKVDVRDVIIPEYETAIDEDDEEEESDSEEETVDEEVDE